MIEIGFLHLTRKKMIILKCTDKPMEAGNGNALCVKMPNILFIFIVYMLITL